MTDVPFEQHPPFVWPEHRVLAGLARYKYSVPFQQVLEGTSKLFGIVCGIDDKGVEWLSHMLATQPDFRCQIILEIFPTCDTRKEQLHRLHRIQSEFMGKVKFRLHLYDRYVYGFGSTICGLDKDGREPVMVTGPTWNFGIADKFLEQPNLTFAPDASLLEEWRRWFDWLWCNSVPLNRNTADIPHLVKPEGTEEARRMWVAYHAQCDDEMQNPNEPVMAEVDPETGEVTTRSADGKIVKSPTDSLDVPKLDPTAMRIAKLYTLGQMVTVDKTSRLKPLDAPMQARYFGMDSFKQVGAVSREVRYRISILHAGTLKEIENRRKAIRDTLNRFSFPLADGARWMPDTALALFQGEMDRLNEEGQQILKDAVGCGVDAFVESRRAQITRDADAMYKDFYPGGSMPSEHIADIMDDLTARLEAALKGNMLPNVTRTPIQFNAHDSATWCSSWGQALTLLRGIAEFPRKVMSDLYFMRGCRVDPDELRTAMDVCGDVINRDPLAFRRAVAELDTISEIMSSEYDEHAKCAGLLALMDGDETLVG